MKAEGREGREGGCQGALQACCLGREGLRGGRVSGREERGGWGKWRSALGTEKPHGAPRRSGVWRSRRQAGKKEQALG